MKTPIQELIEFEEDLSYSFDSDYRIAMAFLEHFRKSKKEFIEKEKKIIIETYQSGYLKPWKEQINAEQYYKKEFQENLNG